MLNFFIKRLIGKPMLTYVYTNILVLGYNSLESTWNKCRRFMIMNYSLQFHKVVREGGGGVDRGEEKLT